MTPVVVAEARGGAPWVWSGAAGRAALPRVERLVWAVAAAAALVRVPFVRAPLSPDEGGFLLVASQWRPGTSLYGNYWVDRPPLLVSFFAVVDQLGRLGIDRAVVLRMLGIGLAMTAVFLAARLGTLVAVRAGASGAGIRRAQLLPAIAAAVFLATPMFDVNEVNGELVAVPLVLWGLAALLEADRAGADGPRRSWLFLAGVAGAGAAMVKQNEIDVLVAAAVAAVTMLPHSRPAIVLRNPAAVAAGALVLTAAVVTVAATRGTSAVGLWDAVVTFRFQASAVISASATSATTLRLHGILVALLVSGAPLVPLLLLANLLRIGRGPLAPLRWPALALVGWETFSVLAGGSYWLHYLVGLVPGVVLCAAVLAGGPARSTAGLRLALGYATAVVLVAASSAALQVESTPKEQPLEAWLMAHARPGDTAVVAFGSPQILQAVGLESPYEELWSLPVRVRDPQLAGFARTLRSPDRPTWVVTLNGSPTNSLATWGVDPAAAQAVLDAHYRVVAGVDGRVIYLTRSRANP
ncbi:MAG: hypothetical protein JWO76_1064 [Nocardioides sp.]|nr:hypothetical protein [Nocardioides sp.]